MVKIKSSIATVPYRIEITSASGNVLIADEPVSIGGKDTGFSPKELLASSLAACTNATLRMYADRKGWTVPEISVTVNLVKGTDMPSGQNTFYCDVKWKGDLAPEQEKRFLEIAKACPIHRLLTKPSEVITTTGP